MVIVIFEDRHLSNHGQTINNNGACVSVMGETLLRLRQVVSNLKHIQESTSYGLSHNNRDCTSYGITHSNL